jgi:hypothetical protein
MLRYPVSGKDKSKSHRFSFTVDSVDEFEAQCLGAFKLAILEWNKIRAAPA